MSEAQHQIENAPVETVYVRPLVAIVGRPNVGKSTIFNRLTGERLAIVDDTPGVTRDRHYADADILGRPITLVDTGGFDPDAKDKLTKGIATQVKVAIEECDLILFAVDARTGPVGADRDTVELLRRSKKPVILVANKADNQVMALDAAQHYKLGVGNLVAISALHGAGIGELEEKLVAALPPQQEIPKATYEAPRVAIIGRPNAGKSSLVNRIAKTPRQLVDAAPGTTVDAIDTEIQVRGTPYVLIDTAGIRKKSAVAEGIESFGVYQAIRAIERCDVAVLLVDAAQGVGEQDAKIAALAIDRGKALVIGLNKSDLLNRDAIQVAKTKLKEMFRFATWIPIEVMSAHTGRGNMALFKHVYEAVKSYRQRVTTAQLNRFFSDVIERHPPPTKNKRSVRLYYITQVTTEPPTFVIVCNTPDDVHISYQRYVMNEIRKRYGFEGTPLRVFYRKRERRQLQR